MLPGIKPGDIILGTQRRVRRGDVVVAIVGNREVIKRVTALSENDIYLQGDNREHSTDSRHYGAIKKEAIVGVVMLVLSKAVDPPHPLKPYAMYVGWGVALVMVLFSLVHLFRIDTFIPILDAYLPGGQGVASLIGLSIIVSEIFAVPFAFRMKLSPLAHFVSGALVVLAPLWWVMVTIWTVGLGVSTGQFGEFITVYATLPVLIINITWLIASYFALYILGYNTLSFRAVLSKP